MLGLNFRRQNLLRNLINEAQSRAGNKVIEAESHEGIMSKLISRRGMIQGIGLASAGIFAGSVITACNDNDNGNAANKNIDPDILNFALNLEYLEAEFYLRSIGQKLSDADRGAGAGTVTGGSQVPFDPNGLIIQYANEIAADELAHVRFLRSVLGSAAVPAPNIDFTGAFNIIGFDPFESELNFLLGAFVFEDVGVTAYHGAAPLITDKNILLAAAGILAVEAYHASNIRTVIFALGRMGNPSLVTTSTNISDARDSLDGDGDQDQPVTDNGMANGNANIVPADSNGIAFARNTDQVLDIVYLNSNKQPGGFFPSGLNGNIK